jgi:hypothetical protein
MGSMGRKYVNGKIFSFTFMLVISIPFLLKGCSPSHNGLSNGLPGISATGTIRDTYLTPILTGANITQSGGSTTLADVKAQIDASGFPPVPKPGLIRTPTFIYNDTSIIMNVDALGSTVTCTIIIDPITHQANTDIRDTNGGPACTSHQVK